MNQMNHKQIFAVVEQINSCQTFSTTHATYTDRAADMHKENMKKKRRDLEQASIDAASDLLDTDSNATFAMVYILFK